MRGFSAFGRFSILGCLLIWSAVTQGQVSSAPNLFYQVPALTIEDVILGRTCYSLPAGPGSLSCNPAELASEEKHQLRFNIFTDNHIGEALEITREVRGGDQIAIMNRLVSNQGATGARLSGAAWYQRDWWALSYLPARLLYVADSRNPAYPEISIHAAQESELALRGGLYAAADSRLQLGLQLRLLERRFLREDLTVIELAGDSSLLKTRDHRAVMLEPGARYSIDNEKWQPAVSLMLSNVQVYSDGASEGDTSPAPELGLSTKPAFAGGRLSASSSFGFRYNPDVWKRLRWGAAWDLGFAHTVLSLAKGEIGVGVSTSIHSVTLGLGYKSEEINSRPYRSSSIESFLFEAGLRF